MQDTGLTPREIYKITNEQSEDGITEEENFIVYFNSAIDEVNAGMTTSFPRINKSEMDISYPNITIEPNYGIDDSYRGLTNDRQIAPSRIYNFDTWIQFLDFEVTDPTSNSAVFGVYQIKGGSLGNIPTLNNDNLYRIVIDFTIRDGLYVLEDIEKAFKVFRLKSGSTPLTFGFEQQGSNMKVFVKPVNVTQRHLSEIRVSESLETSQENITVVETPIFNEIAIPGLVLLDYFRRKFTLPAKWSNKLFVPIMIRAISQYEGDPASTISIRINDINESLIYFRNQVRQALPLILYNPNKKYGDLSNG